MLFRVRLKDARPRIGIFEIIDDYLYINAEEPDLSKAVAGVVDGGHLFHRDLVRAVKNDANISEETRKFINKNYNNFVLHEYFPRGRICYDVNDNMYDIYANTQVAKDTVIMNEILRVFGIPVNKSRVYIDEAQYSLRPKDN